MPLVYYAVSRIMKAVGQPAPLTRWRVNRDSNQEDAMSMVGRGVAVLAMATVLSLVGCTTVRQLESQQTEDLLAAAGFKVKPADTPEKLDHLKSFPAYKMQTRTKDSNIVYTYADPNNCKCLYVGTPKEYQEYKRLEVQQQIAENQRMAAEDAEWAAMNWGVWGPWWW